MRLLLKIKSMHVKFYHVENFFHSVLVEYPVEISRKNVGRLRFDAGRSFPEFLATMEVA